MNFSKYLRKFLRKESFFCVLSRKNSIFQRDREFNSYSGIHILHFSREFVSAKLGRLNGGISNISGARLNENIGTRRGSSINSKDRVVKAKLSFRPWLEYLPQYRKKCLMRTSLFFMHAKHIIHRIRLRSQTVARLFWSSQSVKNNYNQQLLIIICLLLTATKNCAANTCSSRSFIFNDWKIQFQDSVDNLSSRIFYF